MKRHGKGLCTVCKCVNEIETFRCRWLHIRIFSTLISVKKDNMTPLLDWGKYYERDGRVIVPVSV